MTENRTISDEIQDQINHTIQQQPYPTLARIIKTYPDNYADVMTDDFGKITYIKVFGECELETMGVLFFLHNNFKDRVVITGQTIQDYTTLLSIITDLNERISNLEQQINGD